MIKPSDLLKSKTFDAVPAAKLSAYLLKTNWRVVTTEANGVTWFYHDKPPRIKKNYRWSPPTEAYDTASNQPVTLHVLNHDYAVKIIPNIFADYGMHVSGLLNDLERHEDRWKGHILEDILSENESAAH